MRLDKLLAHSGYGSRKEVKEFIRKGYVMVNGEVIFNDDFKVEEMVDEITFYDVSVDYVDKIYYMLNKPKNCVSARVDHSHQTVLDLIESTRNDIFPVGRLDIDTEGLIIITNDGNLAHQLLSPKYHVTKTYYVKFEGTFKESFFNYFKEGILLDDGYKTMPSSVELISDDEAYITISEGKYHQVKRMFAAMLLHVVELKRIRFGNLNLDPDLKVGSYRELSKAEIELLKG